MRFKTFEETSGYVRSTPGQIYYDDDDDDDDISELHDLCSLIVAYIVSDK